MKCRLKEWIAKSKRTQADIAKEMGLTDQQLSNWVTGRSVPPLKKAMQIAKILGCDISDIWEWEED
ncbi:helix-turn-helix transcriptional regulator [Sutcliffiella horikoshii]|uniref:Helix-turn-helix transcriptional regulator n=1 Tax=Sutcliffiella horikoshii TaxID=79883 RepID=A0A5D4SQK8_9BACI|nr:helix-turn-helix transcriptional regulator [Sutcliffiella horikoshii]TYS64478.1 helix-turn-helix transcriptional regulator [Sutcliffiella horikoshii]